MGSYKNVRNIVTGASSPGSGAANAARATSAAKSRAGGVAQLLRAAAEDILRDPKTFSALPRHIQDGIEEGVDEAFLEAIQYIKQQGRVPQGIPRDRALQRYPGPGPEAGFQMGANGGRVPVDSAGELATRKGTALTKNPGPEAGFRMGGGVPPQQFDPTGLSVPSPRDITVRQAARRSRRGFNPLAAAGLGAAAAAGASGPAVNFFADLLGDPVDVVPESATGGAPSFDMHRKNARPATAVLHSARAQRADETARQRQSPEPTFKYGPNDPAARTYRALVDAGVEPARAEGITLGRMAMTQMERDAVVRNSNARAERTQAGIDARRNARMRGY